MLLPLGSVVSVVTRDPRYNGVYTILDTGAEIKGRDLDLYFRRGADAVNFGRKDALVTVLRLGWNPKASTPGLIGRLFTRRELDAAKAARQPPAVPEPTITLEESELPPSASAPTLLRPDAAPTPETLPTPSD